MITNYELDIVRPECNHNFTSVFCYVYFNKNIKDALPYLNANLGGFKYISDPPSVTFKVHGKLITVHQNQISINALKDKEEAEKVASWMIREINEAWENRKEIVPSTRSSETVSIPQILTLLPKTNCKKCSEQTCMVFAVKLRDGIKGPENCPELSAEKQDRLKKLLSSVQYDI